MSSVHVRVNDVYLPTGSNSDWTRNTRTDWKMSKKEGDRYTDSRGWILRSANGRREENWRKQVVGEVLSKRRLAAVE